MTEIQRKTIRALIIIIVSFLFIKLIMSFKKDNTINELEKHNRLVNSKVVKLESNRISVPVYGKLVSKEEVNIVVEASGVFHGNDFKTGYKFIKGDTLGYIKYDEIESNLNSMKSSLLNQTSKVVSEIKFDYPESFNTWYDFMNKISFDKPLPKIPETENKKLKNFLSGKNFFTAYFNAKAAEDRLKKYLIIAEFNGVLSEVTIKSGTAVSLGQKIGKLHNPNILEFEAASSIKNTLLIEKNMKTIIKSEELNGERMGYVSRINKTLNPSSQNMSVFIETNDNDLFHGMYVFGEVIIGKVDKTYLIKRNLLEENSVFIIVDNKLVSKKIEVIQIFEENAIIKGLNETDRILNEPIKGSYHGMEVRINN